MLKRSNDRKVTNAVTKGGNVAIKNTFGLPSGTPFSCPGATSFCTKICYAGRLERQYKNVTKTLISNWETLLYADYMGSQSPLGTAAIHMANEISPMIDDFRADCDKRGADKYFRIHWDGDFFSRDYARAWAMVINDNPDIQFWVYTRSFTDECFVIDILAGIDNLTLYLSADPVNIDLANEVASQYDVSIATVADTFSDAKATIIDDSRKSYACPENRKSIALISDKGSACGRCGICIVGRGDVLFSVSKS